MKRRCYRRLFRRATFILFSSALLLSRHRASLAFFSLGLETTSQQPVKELQTDSDRKAFYVERYGYSPPSVRKERHPNCTKYASGDWEWFALTPSQERSRSQEDRTIYEWFFKDYGGKGTYLELGAFNGVKESNTRFFDECLGWDGLLIEANPRMMPMVQSNRPRAHKMFFAPSCPSESANDTIRFIAGGTTHARQALVGENITHHKQVEQTRHVPCGPLSPVIEDIMNGHINFLSLDVENAEAMVVKTIDWTKVKVDVMISESFNDVCRKICQHRSDVREMMEKAGYLIYVDGVANSDLFIHPSFSKRPPPEYAQGNRKGSQRKAAKFWPPPSK